MSSPQNGMSTPLGPVIPMLDTIPVSKVIEEKDKEKTPSAPIGPIITEAPALASLSKDLAWALETTKNTPPDMNWQTLITPEHLPMEHLGQVVVGTIGDKDLPCFGYARNALEQLIYINVAGPRSLTEAMRSSLSKGIAFTVVTQEATVRLIPAVKLKKDDPPAYTAFEYLEPTARVRHVVLIHRALYESLPGKPQAYLIQHDIAAAELTLLRMVADQTGLPLLSSWASMIWQIAAYAQLLRLCEGAPLRIYRVLDDKPRWRELIQSALDNDLLTF